MTPFGLAVCLVADFNLRAEERPRKRPSMTEACEKAILAFLSSSPEASIEDTYPWSKEQNLDHLQVVGAVKSLLVEEYVATSDLSFSFYEPTKEAKSILETGSQEMVVLKALVEAGKMSMPDLQNAVGKDVAKIGMGNCLKSKWIKKDGGDLVPLVKPDEVTDETQSTLKAMSEAGFGVDAVDAKVRYQFVLVLVETSVV